jgi:hypothetical protein
MLRSNVPLFGLILVAFILFLLAENHIAQSFQTCVSQETAQKSADGSNYDSHDVAVSIKAQFICTVRLVDAHNGFFAAIAAFIVAGFTFTLWRTTDRLWKSSENQIAIAQKTAAAALRQANAMVAIESPVLVIGQVKLVAYPNADDPHSVIDPVLEGEIPPFCRALVGLTNLGRSNARITRMCLEWRIMPILPDDPAYDAIHMNNMDLLFGPNPNLITFFGLDHPANPVVLTGPQRTQIRDGQSLWVYGFFTYRNFMEESFDLGFLTRWNPPYGLAPIANQNYAYHRGT